MLLKKFEQKIQNFFTHLHKHVHTKTILGMACVGFTVLICALCMEYRSFSYQAHKLLKLKKQYRIYVNVLREAIYKYGRLPENLDDDLQACNELSFSSDANVFSSDEQQDDFVFVNREEDYLKQVNLAYLKEQQLEAAIKRIKGEEWFDYPDAFMQPTKEPRKKTRIHRSKAHAIRTQKRIKDMNFAWPINRPQFWLSSFFGPRKLPNGTWRFHHGIDMASLSGTPVKAAAPGKVIEARFTSGYGNTVVVMHNTKYKTRYAHLRSIAVKVGQQVGRGTLIGQVGDTGLVRKSGKDASHLHFEVYAFGKQINPLYCLN
jgi:murein DD-endopeptidase MepM/ murein hydrolase activator NlpD